MSARQRLVPFMLASFVGVASGIYIFDPLLKQYAADSRGTFDPKIAQAGVSGGVGGGANDVTKVAEEANKQAEKTSKEEAKLYGQEARQKLKEALDASRQSSGRGG